MGFYGTSTTSAVAKGHAAPAQNRRQRAENGSMPELSTDFCELSMSTFMEQSLSILFFVEEGTGRIMGASRGAICALGYSKEELVRLIFADLMASRTSTEDWNRCLRQVSSRQSEMVDFAALIRSNDHSGRSLTPEFRMLAEPLDGPVPRHRTSLESDPSRLGPLDRVSRVPDAMCVKIDVQRFEGAGAGVRLLCTVHPQSTKPCAHQAELRALEDWCCPCPSFHVLVHSWPCRCSHRRVDGAADWLQVCTPA